MDEELQRIFAGSMMLPADPISEAIGGVVERYWMSPGES